MWLAAGFVFEPSYFKRLGAALKRHDTGKWLVRPILLTNLWKKNDEGKFVVPLRRRMMVVVLLGSHFRNVGFELEGGARRVGERDEPTAAHDIRRLIHAFGQDPSEEAANILDELEKAHELSEWITDVRYAAANHIRVSREARFTYPSVYEVLSNLSNAEPANAADFRAIVVDALLDIVAEIWHGNADGYKLFWNVREHSKANEIHVDENTCRDRLLNLLRPKIRHLDMVAEPEVRYADDKRADIAVYCRNMKLPIEIKRDDHAEVWSALENQLQKRYTRDPASEGNGIYLVFWFDGKGMKSPPKGIKRPTNADEFSNALKRVAPEASSGLIDVVVVDASVPVEKRAAAIKSAVRTSPTSRRSRGR